MSKQTDALAVLNLCGGKLLANINKSYIRGFSPELALDHANTLIGYVNQFIDSAVEYQGEDLKLAKSEWLCVRANLTKAFERLTVVYSFPEELPRDPLDLVKAVQLPPPPPPQPKSNRNMASEFLNLASAIIKSKYDGNPSDLQSFLDSINLLGSFVEDQMAIAVTFVKTRLTGRARDLITSEDSLNSIANRLKTAIKIPSSAEIGQRLIGLRHSGQSATAFAKEVDELAESLNRSFIGEGVPSDVASKYVTSAVKKALVSNVRDDRVKTILEAQTFETPAGVTARYTELCPGSNQKTVLSYRQRQGGNRGRYNNGNGRGRSRGRGHRYNRDDRNGHNARNDRSDRNNRYSRDNNRRSVRTIQENRDGSPYHRSAGERGDQD